MNNGTAKRAMEEEGDEEKRIETPEIVQNEDNQE